MTIARLSTGHYRGMEIDRAGRTDRNCDNCLDTERTPARIFDYPAIVAAVQEIGFQGEHCGGGQKPSTNHTRGLAARRLISVLPCRKGTIHLQTSMSSPGFEPSPYGTAVSVANHYTGWATDRELVAYIVCSDS
ncbi:hypothetical protein TNCV_165861 [Trichonephila clavipes]|nr:hypothetical protein TNCV_165861 [Trichonephila clavipes]